jgi:SAM-dependent methyltransferase
MTHIIKQTLAGKTINRMLMNAALRRITISGQVLDVGGGNIRSSYFKFFKSDTSLNIVSLDLSSDRKPDIIADVEKPLPLENNQFDHVLCFNLLEHLRQPQVLLSESYRILKPEGSLLGYVPFLVKYHPDPHDYFRYTKEALMVLLQETGFKDIEVTFIGRGPFTASWSQIEFVLPRIIRWPITYLVFALDKILISTKPVFKNTYALGYIFQAHR